MTPAAGGVSPRTVALLGNPNTGKTTVFNLLTGFHARTGNYPGVTVERVSGLLKDTAHITVVDLPGTYSLAARSPDEMITVDVLLGRKEGIDRPEVVVVVIDAANLERNLYLVTQAMELGLPTIVCLNMLDVASSRAVAIDVERLRARLGIEVVPCTASKAQGIDQLRRAIEDALAHGAAPEPIVEFPASLHQAEGILQRELAATGLGSMPLLECRRTLLDFGGEAERRLLVRGGPTIRQLLETTRAGIATGDDQPLASLEAETRYAVIDRIARDVATRPDRPPPTVSDRIDGVLTHRIAGAAIFVLLMGAMFVSIFEWAAPVMRLVDDLFTHLGAWVQSWSWPGQGAFHSLLVDGVIAGVGAVMVFLPQILILFAFIAVLEDCGYMARAAFLLDRLLRWCGLSGKSFIPMLSSFACAVPGLLAARTIESRRDRMLTLLVAPLMSCSARIPIYTIMIAIFIPSTWVLGIFRLQGLVFTAMYFVGIAVAVPVAWIFKRTLFRGRERPFLMELPPYKIPSPRIVLGRLTERAAEFLRSAGTLILAATIVVWALGYWPRGAAEADKGQRLRQSYLGQLGQVIEPAVAPIGWDWKVGVAILASFPAREVVIPTLGVIYHADESPDGDTAALRQRIQTARWDAGPRADQRVFTLASALAFMVFFALCCQCVSTLVVLWRETRSWVWPALTFTYMTILAYLGALLTATVVRALGGE